MNNYQRRGGIYLPQFGICNRNVDIDEEGERSKAAKNMLGQNFGATLGLGCPVVQEDRSDLEWGCRPFATCMDY